MVRNANPILRRGADPNVQLILNEMTLTRQSLMSVLNPQGRDFEKEFGHSPLRDHPASYYRELYDKEGLATRIVGVYADECWSSPPSFYETQDARTTKAERVWKDIEDELNPWSYLHRIDELSGIGHFGLLLLGLPGALNTPAPGFNGKDQVEPGPESLRYLRAFSEDLVQISEWDDNQLSPRYGLPVSYEITFFDPQSASMAHSTAASSGEMISAKRQVHWTRVIHVTDNRKSSEVIGVPRMQPVLKRILDVMKVLGGSAEMFWRGAFPGYAFETHPDIMASDTDMDGNSIRDEFNAYQSGLQRYLRLQNMTVKPLTPQMADPTAHVTELLQSICATLGVPLRIFLGSEAGHLASTQDSLTWNRRLTRRQKLYVTPMVIRPFINRLIQVGVLPATKKGYEIWWGDMNLLSEKDRSDVSIKETQGLLQYITSGAFNFIRPYYYLTEFLGRSTEVANAIIEAAGGEEALLKVLQEQLKAATVRPGDMKDGEDTSKNTGTSGNRNSLGSPK